MSVSLEEINFLKNNDEFKLPIGHLNAELRNKFNALGYTDDNKVAVFQIANQTHFITDKGDVIEKVNMFLVDLTSSQEEILFI